MGRKLKQQIPETAPADDENEASVPSILTAELSDALGRMLVAERDLDAIESVAKMFALAISSLQTSIRGLHLNHLRRIDGLLDEPKPHSLPLLHSQVDQRIAPLCEASARIKHLSTFGLDRWIGPLLTDAQPGQWTHGLLTAVDEAVSLSVNFCSPFFDQLMTREKQDRLAELERVFDARFRDLANLRASLNVIQVESQESSIPESQMCASEPDILLNGPRVLIRSQNERPIVDGVEKSRLTRAQYDVVKALLDAGERGLSKDDLDEKSKHADARRILKRLAESDPGWKAVIHFPGRPGVGYSMG